MKNKRNTWLRRAAAFVLCAALVLMTGIFPTRVQAKSLEDLKQEYNELEKEIEANKKKLESIKNQQTSNAEKMKLLSSQAEAISSQLDVINSQLSVLNADIADYDREIAALDKKIDEAQSKIDKLDEQIDATQEKISERLRATYMAGSSSWIEILLESDSISSLLLRIQLLASVTENDNKLISQLEKQTEELNAAKAELDKLGIEYADFTVSSSNEIQSVVESAVGKVDALYSPTDNTIAAGAAQVGQICKENKLPFIAGEEGMCNAGGLFTLSINYKDLGSAAGKMAVKILKGEAKPEDMPIEHLSTKDLVVVKNDEMAEAIGVDLSALDA